jgi:hypothetical protein
MKSEHFSRDGQAWNWSVSRRVYVTQQQDMSMLNKIIHCIVTKLFIKLTVFRFQQTTFISFIVSPIPAPLSHRKPASAGTLRERYRAYGNGK